MLWRTTHGNEQLAAAGLRGSERSVRLRMHTGAAAAAGQQPAAGQEQSGAGGGAGRAAQPDRHHQVPRLFSWLVVLWQLASHHHRA